MVKQDKFYREDLMRLKDTFLGHAAWRQRLWAAECIRHIKAGRVHLDAHGAPKRRTNGAEHQALAQAPRGDDYEANMEALLNNMWEATAP